MSFRKDLDDWEYYKSDKPPTKWIVFGYLFLIILWIVTFLSCASVKKVFHKERHSKDSTVVTQRDSTSYAHVQNSETKLSIDSIQIVVDYDTGWINVLDEPRTTQEFSTAEGKVLGDVIRAAKNGGKPQRIVISTGKIQNETKEENKEQVVSVAEHKETKLSEKTMVVDKSVTKKKNYLWLILLLIAAGIIYWKRKQIISFILTIIPL